MRVMQRLRQYVTDKRRVRLSNIYARTLELKRALSGIDYTMHPTEYDEIERELQRTRERASALAQKL